MNTKRHPKKLNDFSDLGDLKKEMERKDQKERAERKADIEKQNKERGDSDEYYGPLDYGVYRIDYI